MTIELVLIQSPQSSEKKIISIDLPTVPRAGETLIFGNTENYEVKEVIYRFDAQGTTLQRITVDAVSLSNG